MGPGNRRLSFARTLVVSITVGTLGGTLVLACGGGGGDDPVPACERDVDLPASFALSAPGISVEITAAPYAVTVRDGDEAVVLESLGSGTGDGYGGLAWTTGTVGYSRFFSPGYTTFVDTLDPWRDDLEVVSAEETADSVVLTLRGSGAEDPCVRATHRVRDSTLRVEAQVTGEDAAVPRAWAAAFSTPADEGFLGFGERFNQTDQRGGDVWAWIEEGGIGTGVGTEEGPDNPYPHGEMMTYYAVPFFVSTERYGFWLDTTYRNEFNLASARDDAWRAWHVAPTMAYEVYVPIPDDTRPWPYHLIDRFTETTGRPMMPPAWTFGPRRRIGRNDMQMGVHEVEAMRDLDLAITALDDAMHFYPSGSHVGREQELADWIALANSFGYQVNGYYNSFIDRDPERGIADWAEEGADAGYYVTLENGSYPDLWVLTGGETPSLYLVDFTNPDAAAWYASSFQWALDLGYRGWMYDFAEYMPADAVAFDGRTGEELHNLYPVLYAKTLHEAMEASEYAGEWLAFQRAGYTGTSQYVPFVWSGDPAASFEESDGLPSMIPAGVNLGISGAPHWGGDIGGFHCQADGWEAADGELVTRWIQQGSMSSNMMDQDACVGSSSELKASIWSSTDAMAAWGEYARLHTRLFPYLYTLAEIATATGAPTMRHVFLEHPDQKQLRGVDDAYYFGPALYVAPVIERGATTVTRELPPGTYLDWRDQTVVAGGGEVTLPAPLDKLPLLVRENHLVPLLDPTIDTLADEQIADVVGRADVADVYDVVGLLTAGGAASFAVWDGTTLDATLDGAVAAPGGLTEAADEGELATCDGCYLIDDLGGGLERVRISTTATTVTAGGLEVTADSDRRIRWDLYVVP